jgi:hypothetical protein
MRSSLRLSPAPFLPFNEHIQPILSEYCYHCHGLDSGSRKAGLRLDRAEYALAPHEKNGPAIIPGKPDESPLIKRITSTDEKLKMPPAEAHKTVRPGEIAALHRWIAEGAEYQEHWAFIAPTRPTVPAHASEENPIDAFIRTLLAAEKRTPSPEASRLELIRRVTLDLTGLPPSPPEVDAFLSDRAQGAYQRLIDGLLKRPRESGWDTKRLYRLLVTSATYRQSARATLEKLERDPDSSTRFCFIRSWAISAAGFL